jgi:hypothetical protein
LLSGVPDFGTGSVNVETYTESTQFRRRSNDHDPTTVHDDKILASPSLESSSCSLSVYTYAPYIYYRQHNPHLQLSLLGLSLVKVGECFALWANGGGLLGIISAIPWAYFFVVATVLETHELFIAGKPEEQDGHLDILAGQLATMTRAGGVRKIIMGASSDPRASVWYQLIWAGGAFFCASSLILTYVLLGQQTGGVVRLWAGFQAIWLIARLVVHHLTELVDTGAHRVLVERPWDALPTPMRKRVVELMVAFARYLTLVHPRELEGGRYTGDSFTSGELTSILVDTPSAMHYPLSTPHHGHISVDVQAVIGDTMLSSAAWISGSKGLTPKDLYDCCIVSFSLSSSASPARTIAIPAVRFTTCTVMATHSEVPDMETNISTRHVLHAEFIPKGSPNMGTGNWWWYYVPYGNDLWLLLKTQIPGTILGKQTAEIVNSAQITATLASGILRISLAHVDEVKHAAKLSETSRCAMVSLLAGLG